MIDSSYFKPDAVVIDVGINRIQENGKNRLVGDVDYEDAQSCGQSHYTCSRWCRPMTIAYLMKNTLDAARMQAKHILK